MSDTSEELIVIRDAIYAGISGLPTELNERICRLVASLCDRTSAALTAAHEREAALAKERDAAIAVLNPNVPESGLVDACRQVKQVAVSESANSEEACNQLEALREENARLTVERDKARDAHAVLCPYNIALAAERQKVAALWEFVATAIVSLKPHVKGDRLSHDEGLYDAYQIVADRMTIFGLTAESTQELGQKP